IDAILTRCATDAETGQPIVPVRYAKEYTASCRARDSASREVPRLEMLLKALAKQARTRLGSRTLYGDETVPDFAHLQPLPESLINLVPAMTDVALEPLIAELETAVGTRLRPERPASNVGEFAEASGVSGNEAT